MIGKKELFDEDHIAAGMKTRGCPACDDVLERVLEFFARWISDLAKNEDVRQENTRANGLCPFHTWQMETMGSPLGISRGYAMLMRKISDELQKGLEMQAHMPGVIETLITNAGNCRICRFIRKQTSVYLSSLAKFLALDENRRLYEVSGGLCLRHLSDLIRMTTDPAITQFLLNTAAKQFAAVANDMDRYSAKRSALQKHLLTGAEKSAYLRGLIHAVGGRLVCHPPHEELPASSDLLDE